MPLRTRTMSSLSDVIPGVLTTWNSSSPTVITAFNAVDQIAVGKTTTDVVTPGYFKLKKSGAVLPVNDLTIVSTEVSATESDSTWIYGFLKSSGQPLYGSVQDYTRFRGCLARYLQSTVAFPASPGLKDSSILNMVSQDALAAARTKSWDFLTFLAEFHETKELIRNVATRVAKRAAKIYSRGRPATVSAMQDMWMEYRYGWRLLAYDIEDMNGAISRLVDGYPEVFKSSKQYLEPLSSTSSTARKDVLYWRNANTVSSMSCNCSTDLKTEVKIYNRVKAGVAVRNEGRGLSFADPLVTAFDIIPLSMILEWFTNIGDLIAAWSPFATQGVAWNYATIETVSERLYTATPVSRDPGIFYPWAAARLVSGSNSILSLRSVVKHRFTPPLELSLQFRNSFDWPKLFDLAAILGSRVRGLRLFFNQSYYAPRSPLADYVRRLL